MELFLILQLYQAEYLRATLTLKRKWNVGLLIFMLIF